MENNNVENVSSISEEDLEILKDNISLTLDEKKESHITSIKEHLKEIRKEIEDTKKSFLEDSQNLSEEEYDNLPKTPINRKEIDKEKELAQDQVNGQNYTENSKRYITNLSADTIFNTMLNCDMLSFYTSPSSTTSKYSDLLYCSAIKKTLEIYIDLRQPLLNEEEDLLIDEKSVSYLKIKNDYYEIDKKSLGGLFSLIFNYYTEYKALLSSGNKDVSLIENKKELPQTQEDNKLGIFDKFIIYLLNITKDLFSIYPEREKNSNEDYYSEYFKNLENIPVVLEEEELNSFISNLKEVKVVRT